MNLARKLDGSIDHVVGTGDSAFTLKLRPLSYAERMQCMAAEIGIAQRGSGREEFLEFLFGLVTGWKDVNDADGKPVPFTAQALKDAVASDSTFGYSIYTALQQHVDNRLPEAAVKN